MAAGAAAGTGAAEAEAAEAAGAAAAGAVAAGPCHPVALASSAGRPHPGSDNGAKGL